MAFDLTKPTMTDVNWAAALGFIRENFRAIAQGDAGVLTKIILGQTGAAAEAIRTENGVAWNAKNTTGTVENFLIPRYTDNVTYLNFGSGGFAIRTNTAATALSFGASGESAFALDTALTPVTINVPNAAAINDVAIGTAAAVEFSNGGVAAGFNLTGLASGRQGRIIVLTNLTGQIMTVQHLNAGSLAANRIYTKTAAAVAVGNGVTFTAWYSLTTGFWHQI